MTVDKLLAKAETAVISAQLLLNAGDHDGASNRAYYAMFDAARAGLTVISGVNIETIRSHNGLITVFSQHLVKTGRLEVELGRNLNRVEEIRLIADYKGDSIDQKAAAWAVEQAAIFLDTIKELINT
ncbi:MAG: DNA-binding protein [Thiothrix nivea]|nr:MAG: DNA-binding protein [Thiothrix nivea]